MDEAGLFRAAEGIYRAALEAVDAGRLVREAVAWDGGRLRVAGEDYPADSFRRVVLIAFGKAAVPMASAAAAILGDRLDEGLVVAPAAVPVHPKVLSVSAGHPLPDEGSVRGARTALDIASRAEEDDLVLLLVSGGGSSLVSLPSEGITLEEKRRTTRALLEAGATIQELNTVRKHLSDVKGGRLAAAAFPARVVALVLSDVPENDLETIASGPAHWDTGTYSEALRVLERLDPAGSVPESVRRVLREGAEGRRLETMKPDDPVFSRVRTVLLADNMTALQAAKARAEELGFEGIIMTAADGGEAKAAAHKYVEFVDRLICSLGRPLCLLAGGELTVRVTGRGKGGRNMEFVLAALAEIDKGRWGGPPGGARKGPGRSAFGDFLERARSGPGRRGKSADWLVLSLGTDGIDGPTDAAGAWIDRRIFEEVRRLKLEPEKFLAENDSYAFFDRLGRLVKTGPTGTNVMDLRLFLLAPEGPGP